MSELVRVRTHPEARPRLVGPGLAPKLTVADLAVLLRRTPKTIRRWRLRGKMPPCIILPDGETVWDPRDVEKWLESRKG